MTWRGVVRPSENQLLVSEVFGPTVQGEGPAVGRAASFLRLGACNLSCVWCDTSYTWDATRHDLATELTARPVSDIAAEILAIGAPMCVITGGEPMLQAAALLPLVRTLKGAGLDVHIETNGTVGPGCLGDFVDLFVVSPKSNNSGVAVRARYRHTVLDQYAMTATAVFKFVVSHPPDLAEVDDMVATLDIPVTRVWVTPEGTTADQVAERSRTLVPHIAQRGFALGTRLHVTLWGDTRGH